MSDLRNALIDAVTLYRDAKVNTRQVPDGLNAIIACAGALVDSWLPTDDDVRGILAAPQPEPSAGLRNVEAAIDDIESAVREMGGSESRMFHDAISRVHVLDYLAAIRSAAPVEPGP